MVGPGQLPSASAASVSLVPVYAYLTTPDKVHLLEYQTPLAMTSGKGIIGAVVNIDRSQRFQTMDGFGASLTESSASVLSKLSADQRATVLTKLFDPAHGAGLSFLRQPLGASDFALANYTYDDMPSGQKDPTLANFSISRDKTLVIPQLQQIKRINPSLNIMATPWSPPAWMKTGDSLLGGTGGTLQPQYYDAYAQYLARSMQAYAASGLGIKSLTIQNEPGFAPTGYPGMALSAADEAAFVPHLAAAFGKAALATKIIAFDHNWDLSSYARSVLSDTKAGPLVDGTAFHCYGGDVSAQSQVHSAFPSKNIYFTECSGGDWAPDFAGNLAWSTHNLVIGATRNWAKTVATWNLALDGSNGPTNGGCTTCRGVVKINTITGAVEYNVEYYALGQIAKVVHPGATRIASDSDPNRVETVAFQNVDGSYALVAHNTTGSASAITVGSGTQRFSVTLPQGAVESFTWGKPATTTTAVVTAPTATASTQRSPLPNPSPTRALLQTGWSASASPAPMDTNNWRDVPRQAIDRTITTRWSTGRPQSSGQWLQVDMRARKAFNQVVLDAGHSTGDYPRRYQIYVSNDGHTWGKPVAAGSPRTQATSAIFATQFARYIRVVNTGSAANWWSVAEFAVALAPKPLA